MRRILQVSNYYFPNVGGIEEVARSISKSCESDQYEIKVICFNSDTTCGDKKCSKGEDVYDIVDGIEVIRCSTVAKIASQSISFSFGKKLKKVMETFKPEIVFLHYPNPLASYYVLKYIKNETKLILYWHSDIVKQKITRYFFYRQNLKLLTRANKIVATSPCYIDGSKWLASARDKCVVIPNCIDSNKMAMTDSIYEYSKKIKEDNEGKFICFAVGRHVEYKGFEYLIEAAKLLDDDCRVYLGGAGPLTNKLKKEADGLKNIVFLGRLSNEEMVAYFYACDVFCFPSITKNEAFGIALAEGMFFGKPVVSFNIPGSGVNFVSINNVTGIEVENCNVTRYAEAIIQLKDNREMREKYGIEAADRVNKLFTYPIFKNNIVDLINNIIN